MRLLLVAAVLPQRNEPRRGSAEVALRRNGVGGIPFDFSPLSYYTSRCLGLHAGASFSAFSPFTGSNCRHW